MLPRIYYQDQQNQDSKYKGWHVNPDVTQRIKFFQTNQNENFDPACIHRDRVYHTLSFIYKIKSNNENIFFAYDEPYTYSGNLRDLLLSIRDNPQCTEIMEMTTMCHSLGGVPCKLITITENIHFNLAYFDMLTMYHKKEARDRFMIKDSINKMSEENKEKKIAKLIEKRKLNIEHMKQ